MHIIVNKNSLREHLLLRTRMSCKKLLVLKYSIYLLECKCDVFKPIVTVTAPDKDQSPWGL